MTESQLPRQTHCESSGNGRCVVVLLTYLKRLLQGRQCQYFDFQGKFVTVIHVLITETALELGCDSSQRIANLV